MNSKMCLIACYFRSELDKSGTVRIWKELQGRYRALLIEMRKLNLEFNSTQHELCNAKQKMAEAVATADIALKALSREYSELKSELLEALQRVSQTEINSAKGEDTNKVQG
jgi:uncharacterized iron-regulated protein